MNLPRLLPAAADPGTDFLEVKIRPVLAEHCLKCHSAEAAKIKKFKGGLLLDSRDGLRKGGDSGPSVVPGKPTLTGRAVAALQKIAAAKAMAGPVAPPR